MKSSRRIALKEKAREMFYHGYDNYMMLAFPEDELNPLKCSGRSKSKDEMNWNLNDVLGDYCLTLIDSLDALAILGDVKGFHKAINQVIKQVPNFNIDSRVQVFEVTIRILGGLISAHLLVTDTRLGFYDEDYNDQLLLLAIDLGNRLLPAFESPTGIPWPRVNLKKGRLPYETSSTCAAGAGTLILEFGMLSRLTGNPIYEEVARKALLEVWERKSPLGLIGNSLDMQSGAWLENVAYIGAGVDSIYEYFLKGYILFDDLEYFDMFSKSYSSVNTWVRDPNLYLFKNVDMETGDLLTYWVDSLSAFWPGLQVLAGDIDGAIISHQFLFTIWRKYHAFPERFDFNAKTPNIPSYPLRPELIESTYFLYQATKNPYYLHVGEQILEDINKYCRTLCGFAGLSNVLTKTKDDRMESFFLSETLKYLYLLFDTDNIFNKLDSNFVFTTEGHIFVPPPYFTQLNVIKSKVRDLSNATCQKFDHTKYILKYLDNQYNDTAVESTELIEEIEYNLMRTGHVVLPLPLKVIHEINSAVGISEEMDEFFHHVILPADATTSLYLNRGPISKSSDKKWFDLLPDLLKRGTSSSYDLDLLNSDLLKDNICLKTEEVAYPKDGSENNNFRKAFTYNNNRNYGEKIPNLQGSKYELLKKKNEQLLHNLKVTLPEGFQFDEEAKIIKTSTGYVTNTLKDVQLQLQKLVTDDFFLITKINNKLELKRNEVLKVKKRGIYWLLNEEESNAYRDQHNRPNKLEFEKILLEFAISNKIEKFGAGVAQFGSALLPGQVISGNLIPLLSNMNNINVSSQLSINDVSLGCEARDFINLQKLNLIKGNFILVRRGECAFQDKSLLVESFGGIGMIVLGLGLENKNKKKVITMEKLKGFKTELSILNFMLNYDDSMIILKNFEKKKLFEASLEYFCLPVKAIGESPPSNPLIPAQQITLRYSNFPIKNLVVVQSGVVSEKQVPCILPTKQHLKDPRRRSKGNSLVEISEDLFCIYNCLSEMKNICCSQFKKP
ncbi:ER degradation-enhancing alpha-mannosidase-like protein 1 [Lobulomyces angularis]|nr:ER degradation-enhancing alpha-mannosidase-like protein 1 [Lobulomyces angularis]